MLNYLPLSGWLVASFVGFTWGSASVGETPSSCVTEADASGGGTGAADADSAVLVGGAVEVEMVVEEVEEEVVELVTLLSSGTESSLLSRIAEEADHRVCKI